MRRLFIGILLSLTTTLVGQTTGTVPFSESFVSRVTSEAKEGGIVITWKDSNFFQAPVYEIYRHTVEITKENFNQSVLVGSVAQGAQKFEDKPGDQKNYYYLVLIKGDQNQRLEVFVTYRNKTSDPVAALPQGTEKLAEFSFLQGVVANQEVLLTWVNKSQEDRNLLVLRTTRPVNSFEDLKDATSLGTVKASAQKFQSPILGGIDFYYTLVDSRGFAEKLPQAWRKGLSTIGPLVLSLAVSPTFSGSRSGERGGVPGLLPLTQPLSDTSTFRLGLPDTRRALPLPRLNLMEGVETGLSLPTDLDSLPPKSTISAKAQAVYAEFNKSSPVDQLPFPELTFLKDDLTGAAKGSQGTLDGILKTSLKTGGWVTARVQLETLLKLDLDPKMKSRVHFYIGQTYIQEKNLSKAFLEILLARDHYFKETQGFLDGILSRLKKGSDF